MFCVHLLLSLAHRHRRRHLHLLHRHRHAHRHRHPTYLSRGQGVNYFLYAKGIAAFEAENGIVRGARNSWESFTGAFGMVPNKALVGVPGCVLAEAAMTGVSGAIVLKCFVATTTTTAFATVRTRTTATIAATMMTTATARRMPLRLTAPTCTSYCCNSHRNRRVSCQLQALAFTALAVTDETNNVPKGAAPGLIGITVALLAAQYGPVTGCGMNPARDLGESLS